MKHFQGAFSYGKAHVLFDILTSRADAAMYRAKKGTESRDRFDPLIMHMTNRRTRHVTCTHPLDRGTCQVT